MISQFLAYIGLWLLSSSALALILALSIKDKAMKYTVLYLTRATAICASAMFVAMFFGACSASEDVEPGEPVAGSPAVDAGTGPIVEPPPPPPAEDAGPEVCARAEVTTSPVTPTVWLIVDGSTSMNLEFDGGTSRWAALRETIVDPRTGVVAQLQAAVKFGLVLYSGANDTCTEVRVLEPQLMALDAITAFYPTQVLGGGTPTDRALERTLKLLDPAATEPQFVVLATDGQPNSGCANTSKPTDPEAEARVVALAQNAPLDVISLAGNDSGLRAHLEAVAAVTRDKRAPYTPSTSARLVQAFQDIVGTASCVLELDGSVRAGEECSGEVTLNGRKLECGTDYVFQGNNELVLSGAACQEYSRTKSQVSAVFPCGTIIPE